MKTHDVEARALRETFEPDAGIDMSVLETRAPPPQLPLDVFGRWHPSLERIAQASNSPVDYVATALMAGVGAVICNAVWVTAFDGTFSQPSFCWFANVGEPGAHKTPAAGTVLHALHRIEAGELERLKPELERYAQQIEVAKAIEGTWRDDVRAAAKGKQRLPDRPLAAVLPVKPIPPRLIANDATPEALMQICRDNPRGVMLVREELTGWHASLDRYSNATGRAMFLEAYDGGTFRVDTKGGGSLLVPRLSIPVFGGLQPDKFARLVLKSDDDGLPSRFLWTWPGTRMFVCPEKHDEGERVHDALKRLRGLVVPRDENGLARPHFVALDNDGGALFADFCRRHEREDEGSGGRLYKSWRGKGSGQVLRLASVLEHLDWSYDGGDGFQPRSVSGLSVERAVRLYRYFDGMARRTFGDASLPEHEHDGAALARMIVRHRLHRVNARELRRGKPERINGTRDAARVHKAIAFLVEAQWLVAAGTRQGDTAGRKSGDYDVNPRLLLRLVK